MLGNPFGVATKKASYTWTSTPKIDIVDLVLGAYASSSVTRSTASEGTICAAVVDTFGVAMEYSGTNPEIPAAGSTRG